MSLVASDPMAVAVDVPDLDLFIGKLAAPDDRSGIVDPQERLEVGRPHDTSGEMSIDSLAEGVIGGGIHDDQGSGPARSPPIGSSQLDRPGEWPAMPHVGHPV
jgi:hypothetical protein